MATNRILIQGGHVMTMDPALGNLSRGDVLIEGSKIVGVGADIAAEDCDVLDAEDMIVMPGMVDGHKHTWQVLFRAAISDLTFTQFFGDVVPVIGPLMTPEDVYASNLLGAVDALNAGITTFVDWCHITKTPDHTRAAVAALEESGARAWFGHAPSLLTWDDRSADHPNDILALQKERFSLPKGLVKLAMAARGPAFTEIDTTRRDFAMAREMDVPISVHVAMAGYPSGDVVKLAEAGLLGPDVCLLHGNAMSDEEIRLAAGAGCKFVDSSPLDVLMGIGPALTGRYLAAGIRPGISSDTALANSTDLFWVMRAMILMERTRVYQKIWDAGGQVTTAHLTSHEMLELATVAGAESVWMANDIGSLTPGKEADVAILRGLDLSMVPLGEIAATIVTNANSGNVDTVLVAGRIVKRNGKMVSVDEDRVRNLALAARDRLYAEAAAAGLRTDLFGMRPPTT